MISIFIILLTSTFTALAEVSKPAADYSYSTDVWIVRDFDYGTFSVMAANTGEPVAPITLSVRLSCLNAGKKPYHTVLEETVACEYKGHEYDQARSQLVVQYKPYRNGSCADVETKTISIRKSCTLYREPSSQKKK